MNGLGRFAWNMQYGGDVEGFIASTVYIGNGYYVTSRADGLLALWHVSDMDNDLFEPEYKFKTILEACAALLNK